MSDHEFNQEQFLETVLADQVVQKAISDTNWFTVAKLLKIVEETMTPARTGFLGSYVDPRLAACLAATELPLSQKHKLFHDLYHFLNKHMISPQGHAFASTFIPFLSADQVSNMLSELGLPAKFDIDRGVQELTPSMLLCLVAPEELRNQLVKIIFSTGDQQMMQSLLVWAMVVRAGTQAYLERGE